MMKSSSRGHQLLLHQVASFSFYLRYQMLDVLHRLPHGTHAWCPLLYSQKSSQCDFKCHRSPSLPRHYVSKKSLMAADIISHYWQRRSPGTPIRISEYLSNWLPSLPPSLSLPGWDWTGLGSLSTTLMSNTLPRKHSIVQYNLCYYLFLPQCGANWKITKQN